MTLTRVEHHEHRFAHEALLHAGDAPFVEGVAGFLAEAVANGEAAMAVVSERKIDLLRRRLGDAADHVEFADMAEVGHNPARLIPIWHDFLERHAGGDRPVRGVGEPVFAGRTADEVVECRVHEALLNLAFADAPPFRLLCSYDTSALDPDWVGAVGASHPTVVQGTHRWASGEYLAGGLVAAAFDEVLPPVPPDAVRRTFDLSSLRSLRRFTAAFAEPLLSTERVDDLLLAVSELAANSVSHGGGHGVLSLWHDDAAVHVEVDDDGRLDQPLVGRIRPEPTQPSGRGLWIVNQVCDLVQVRTGDAGTVVRIHLSR